MYRCKKEMRSGVIALACVGGWRQPLDRLMAHWVAVSALNRGFFALMGSPVRRKGVFSPAPPFVTTTGTSEPSAWCPHLLLKVDRRICWKSLWAGPMLRFTERSPRRCLSREPEVFVCVCSRVYRAFLWVVVDFWAK